MGWFTRLYNGNAVLVKPASATPLPALIFTKILLEAGYRPNALGVLPVSGAEAERLVADDRIAAVSFTGSYESGVSVVKAGGVKQYVLELGSGDPVIVMEDADLQLIARGIYSYAGQRCDAIKLVLAESAIYHKLKEGLAARLASVKVGDPRSPDVEMGPLNLSRGYGRDAQSYKRRRGERRSGGGWRRETRPKLRKANLNRGARRQSSRDGALQERDVCPYCPHHRG
jgi:acyl-CoA reductase-like NAD-dependent aldehyde dehydrogenase